jgi:hypothetical protein
VRFRESDILNQQGDGTEKWWDGGLPYYNHVPRYSLKIVAVSEGNGDSTRNKTYCPELSRMNFSHNPSQRIQHCNVSRKETPLVSKTWRKEGRSSLTDASDSDIQGYPAHRFRMQALSARGNDVPAGRVRNITTIHVSSTNRSLSRPTVSLKFSQGYTIPFAVGW